MNLTIRRAELGDLDVLVRFAQAMAHETESRTLDPDTVRAGVRAPLLDPDRGAYFIAEHDAASPAAGALMVTREWSDWRNGFLWWIQSVYVRPECRRQGIYRQLYAHVRQQAEEKPDVCGLRLYVEKENTAARVAYETLGMVQTSYRLYECIL